MDSARCREQGKRSLDCYAVEANNPSAAGSQRSSENPVTTNVSERAITEKDRALVYEDGRKRFEFHASLEGYKMFTMLIDRTIPVIPDMPRQKCAGLQNTIERILKL